VMSSATGTAGPRAAGTAAAADGATAYVTTTAKSTTAAAAAEGAMAGGTAGIASGTRCAEGGWSAKGAAAQDGGRVGAAQAGNAGR